MRIYFLLPPGARPVLARRTDGAAGCTTQCGTRYFSLGHEQKFSTRAIGGNFYTVAYLEALVLRPAFGVGLPVTEFAMLPPARL